MRNRTVIYPSTSSAISSITIYPQDRLVGIEYSSSCKAYTYVLKDLKVVHDLVDAQASGASIGSLVNKSIKDGRLSLVK